MEAHIESASAEPVRCFGAHFSPQCDLDAAIIYSSRDVSLPSEIDYTTMLPGVRDQGDQPTCVAFALATIIEYFAAKKYGGQVFSPAIGLRFSPQYLYNVRVTRMDGMFMSEACGLTARYGCCYENTYPYGARKSDTATDIPPEAHREALDWRSKALMALRSVESIKSAVVNNGPCAIAFTAYNTGSRPWRQNGGENSQGMHCMCIVGYTPKSFILRNSWGKGWAENGYTTMDFSEWAPKFETWTIVDNPDIHPQQEPKPPKKGGGDGCLGGCSVQ